MNGQCRENGVLDYDFENDSLFFNNNKSKFDISIDLGDLIVDIGEDGVPIGVELLNASKHLKVSKIALRNDIKVVEANVEISEKEIEVKISVFVESRNKLTEAVSILYGLNDVNLQPGQTALVC
ncbi:MAG: hypothetical protein QG646_1565 [Euryarchaeota archaeon]|nr:hypothetical protein [Euryarchaeota archaeon]